MTLECSSRRSSLACCRVISPFQVRLRLRRGGAARPGSARAPTLQPGRVPDADALRLAWTARPPPAVWSAWLPPARLPGCVTAGSAERSKRMGTRSPSPDSCPRPAAQSSTASTCAASPSIRDQEALCGAATHRSASRWAVGVGRRSGGGCRSRRPAGVGQSARPRNPVGAAPMSVVARTILSSLM